MGVFVYPVGASLISAWKPWFIFVLDIHTSRDQASGLATGQTVITNSCASYWSVIKPLCCISQMSLKGTPSSNIQTESPGTQRLCKITSFTAAVAFCFTKTKQWRWEKKLRMFVAVSVWDTAVGSIIKQHSQLQITAAKKKKKLFLMHDVSHILNAGRTWEIGVDSLFLKCTSISQGWTVIIFFSLYLFFFLKNVGTQR